MTCCSETRMGQGSASGNAAHPRIGRPPCEGAAIAQAPRRISGTAQALLGAALVSAGLFWRECGRGGRGNDQEIH